MSRSGDHLSGKLMQELRSAFALIFKNLGTDAVTLGIEANAVIYPCLSEGQAKHLPVPAVSELTPRLHDGLGELCVQDCDIETIALFKKDTLAMSEIRCGWQATLVSEPIFTDNNAQLNSIDFDHLRHPADFSWSCSAPGFAKNPAGKSDNISPVMTLPISPMATQSHALSLPKPAGEGSPPKAVALDLRQKKSHAFPSRLWQQPFVKRPLPPHRFPSEIKNRMRQALAEKAKVNPASIQLQVIFDRINLGLFSSIDQDEKGNLICYLKPDILHQPEKARHFPNAYLVFGMRMDTKETIKALVPMQDQEREVLKHLD